jgi:hypothetical protein
VQLYKVSIIKGAQQICGIDEVAGAACHPLTLRKTRKDHNRYLATHSLEGNFILSISHRHQKEGQE